MAHQTRLSPSPLSTLTISLKLGYIEMSCLTVSLSLCILSSNPPTPPQRPLTQTGWETPHKGRHHQGNYRPGSVGQTQCHCHRRSCTWLCWSHIPRCPGWAGRCGRSRGGRISCRLGWWSHLTPTLHISIVTIVLPLTAEGQRIVGPEDDKRMPETLFPSLTC